jgi:hypothetical protein
MSVKSVQRTVAAHIMAALGYQHGEKISSATLAESVNADPTSVCGCMAQVFTWAERKFRRRSGRGSGKPFFVSIPAMSSGCVI